VLRVPVNVVPLLPIVAALMVVPVNVPATPKVPPTVTELLTVNAFTVALLVARSVDTIAVLPPADPNVPFNGPLIASLAVTVAPVNVAPELPIVAALMVVPVNVPTTPKVLPIVAELLTVNALVVKLLVMISVLLMYSTLPYIILLTFKFPLTFKLPPSPLKVVPPRSIVLPDRYISLNRCVGLPRL